MDATPGIDDSDEGLFQLFLIKAQRIQIATVTGAFRACYSLTAGVLFFLQHSFPSFCSGNSSVSQ